MDKKEEHAEDKSECSMLKQSLLFIFKFMKQQGCKNLENFIDFWEKQ